MSHRRTNYYSFSTKICFLTLKSCECPTRSLFASRERASWAPTEKQADGPTAGSFGKHPLGSNPLWLVLLPCSRLCVTARGGMSLLPLRRKIRALSWQLRQAHVIAKALHSRYHPIVAH